MKLRNRLLTLPQELYDEIYELTFTLDTTKVIKVNMSYKPPFQLHLNRALREKYGKKYYSSTAGFRLDVRTCGWEMLVRWLSALTSDNQMALQRVELFTGASQYPDSDLALRNMAGQYLQYAEELLEAYHIVLYMRILHVDSTSKEGAGTVWVSRKDVWS